jgi:rhomboid protease GluP
LTWLLDPNRAFWLLVELSCLFVLVRTAYQWRRLGRDRDARDAAVTAGVVGGLGAGLYFRWPQSSGYTVAGVWLVLLVLPALGLRGAQWLALGRRYAAAAGLVRWIGILRPLASWRDTYAFYWGLSRWAKGDKVGGLFTWQELVSRQGVWAEVVAVERFALEGQWEEVIHRIERVLTQPGIMPVLLPRYLRALGETGRLGSMLNSMAQRVRALATQPALLAQCLLPVFAFTGRTERLRELLQGPLAGLDRASQDAWLGTAELARGDRAAGQAHLLQARSRADGLQEDAIQRRLARPPTLAEPLLLAPERRLLDQLAEHSIALGRVMPACLPRRFPLVTWSIACSLLVMFLVELGRGGTTSPDTLLSLGALDPALVHAGQWWRLLAAQWLHFGPVHFGLNVLALLWLGVHVERALGRLQAAGVYLAAGTLGMLAHALLANLGLLPHAVLVGASGGVMGLAGASGAILLEGWRKRGLMVARLHLRWIVTLVLTQAVADLFLPAMSFLGHALGAAVGFGVAGVFVRLGWRWWLMVVLPGLALSGVGEKIATLLPWRRPPCSPGEVATCEATCELGLPESCAALGYKYGIGEDVAQDFARARALLARACQGGVMVACADLGVMHDRAEGGPRDHRRAFELYTQACRAENAFGCRNLALSLLRGEGTARDPAQARVLLQRACSADDQKSCELVGKTGPSPRD